MFKITWVLKGFVLGVAGLIPGVSAGTLAVIMGIYEKIILYIDQLITFKIKKQDLLALLLLGLGTFLAIFSLSRGMSYILSSFPLEVYSFFIGLIVASIPKLFELTNKKTSSILYISGVALGVFIFLNQMPELHLDHFLFSFFISGFLGVFISVLPGISGSMILVILGTYQGVLQALNNWEWLKLALFMQGGLLGLLVAFYFVRLFMRKHRNSFFCLLIGLILGGLPEILPWEKWQSMEAVEASIHVVLFIFLGVGVIFVAEKRGFLKKREI